MVHEPTWRSLRNHATPAWLRDAKFGIYTHWGIYSVPACGPNATWYPHNMYRKGTPQYDHHVRTYGHPSVFGYKDFIPMFTAERFDPEEWADLFKRAGARFAGPVGEHHDGFSMWDTDLNPWNSARMGPRRDVVGELERAVRGAGMRFMVALHHAENWFFFPHWEPGYDTADPRFAGLYGPHHNQALPATGEGETNWTFEDQDPPTRAFHETWLAKVTEVVDRFQPDLLWFDYGLKYLMEGYKLKALAHYYNRAEEWGREVAVTYKWQDLVVGSGVTDLELGRFDQLTYHDWITDTTVDDGSGWGYLRETRYKTPASLIHYLVDNVSKNGYLLLNVGPKPDGTIPEEARDILLEMGDWLAINGEAIYGTTPWYTYGEGPTTVKSGHFGEGGAESPFTSEDIRYTAKDETLYAIILGIPGDRVVLRSLKGLVYAHEVNSVEMLGADGPLPFEWTPEGLAVRLPREKPCRHAVTLRLNRSMY